jgi:hypothetical protein
LRLSTLLWSHSSHGTSYDIKGRNGGLEEKVNGRVKIGQIATLPGCGHALKAIERLI